MEEERNLLMSEEEKQELIFLEKWLRSMGLLKQANILRKLLKKEEILWMTKKHKIL